MGEADAELVCLGVITGVHGLKGEVKLKSFTQDPEGVGGYGVLRNQDGSREFVIANLRQAKDVLVVKFADINDRTQAEALKGVELYTLRTNLPEIADQDTWYHADLVGLKAHSDKGELLGTIIAIYNFGAGDLLEIKWAGSNDSELVPFTKITVPEIDIAGGRIIVTLPEMIEDEPK